MKNRLRHMHWARSIFFSFLLGGALIAFGNHMRPPPDHIREDLDVMVPIPAQIFSAFGDRFLASNAGTWRAIMVGARTLSADELTALAQIQLSAAWLNPGHEDNYYIATAILPWAGKVDETQQILQWATEARPHDVYAPFFHGFNAMNFLGDFATATRSAQIAAAHSGDIGEKQALSVIAARWSEKSDDSAMALRIVKKMADDSKDPALKNYLMQRAIRLEGLVVLRTAAQEFRKNETVPLRDLKQLVQSGLITVIPDDPLGGGYTLKNEWPIMLPPKE
jgi:hypothetical protein